MISPDIFGRLELVEELTVEKDFFYKSWYINLLLKLKDAKNDFPEIKEFSNKNLHLKMTGSQNFSPNLTHPINEK